MGVIEGNQLVSGNTWEQIKQGGEPAIKRWINTQMAGKSVVIVCIGPKTSQRKYVKYEIEKGWKDRKGVLGIHIHNLKNLLGEQALKGSNPFASFTVNGTNLSSIAKTYDPPYTTSTYVYEHINDNLAEWVEEAIMIRKRYG